MRTQASRLVDTYADLILRLSYTIVGSTHDAQDVCQDVLLKLLTSANEFSSAEHERAWVIRVTINAARDLMRAGSRHAAESIDDLGDRGPAAPCEEGALVVRDAVARLPLEQREAVYLRYFEGFTVGQIAGLVGASEDAVAKRLERARRRLRELLEEESI